MKLSEYFDNARGRGVLATSDSRGEVNAALYSRPHFKDEETVMFIMGERLSHENLKSNPHAAYIFMEEGTASEGKRLYLTKIGEEMNDELVETLRKKHSYVLQEDYLKTKKYVVTFRVNKISPLITHQ
jgi:putative heme iron utilization protein